jgi:hypothetical protein
MRADSVDPNELEAMLRRMATAIGSAQDGKYESLRAMI